jgi:hypothetical protein
MTNTTSKEETVTSIIALINKRKKELLQLEASVGKKKTAINNLKTSIKVLETRLKKSNEKRKKGFTSLAGKWYLNTADSNRMSKKYVFVKEDLGYITVKGWVSVRRKLLINILSIERTVYGDNRNTTFSFQVDKGYSYFSDPNHLKPVSNEEIEREVLKQYKNYSKKLKDFGLNLPLPSTEKTK